MMKKLLCILSLTTLLACSSNNCPLESTVLCNYYFYDQNGVAVKYGDPFSVSTLLPGHKTVYTYRKLGNQTMTFDQRDTAYINAGYSETISTVRKDTILVNKASDRSFIQVPMSYFNKADTLIFDYSSISGNDTIIIEHEGFAHVELPECGTHVYHHLRSIRATDAAIDHIEIKNPLVDYEGNENIRIYFNGVAQ